MSKPHTVYWYSTPLIRISIAVHLLLLALLLWAPQYWKIALVVFMMNHLLITIVGLLPRSHWLGSNWTRLPEHAIRRNEVALTIDDGPDPQVTPQVLSVLDNYQVKATFFCIGNRAKQYPELCREIVQRGHSIGNHSQRHWHNFSMLGSAGLTREIIAAQHTLHGITGIAPNFFRAPAGLRNLFLAPVLDKLNLQLASWSVRAYDTKVTQAERVKHTLLNGLKPGAIILLHDGHAARTANNEPMILAVLPALFEAAKQRKLHFVTLSQAAVR